MRPIAQSDRHDFPGLIDELVPGVAAVIDDIVIGFEDAVREPVVAHELPDIFLRVQLRAFGWQRDQRDIRRDDQGAGETPSGLIDQKGRMRARRDLRRDLGQMEVHRLSIASRHDERRALAVLGTDRPEDIGRCGSLVFGRARARAGLGPTPGDLVLLADARFVGEPDFYGVGLDAFFAPDLLQARGETFLKSSMAPSACA
jgi:hypothetical protein